MKRFFLFSLPLALALLIAGSAFAFGGQSKLQAAGRPDPMSAPIAASKTITSSTTIKSTSGALYSILATAGTNDLTVTLYDNTGASGDVLAKMVVDIDVAGKTLSWTPSAACPFSALYAEISGTVPSVTIVYQ